MDTTAMLPDAQATIDLEKDRAALRKLMQEYVEKVVRVCIATMRHMHPSASTWSEHDMRHAIQSCLIAYRLDLQMQINNEVLRQTNA